MSTVNFGDVSKKWISVTLKSADVANFSYSAHLSLESIENGLASIRLKTAELNLLDDGFFLIVSARPVAVDTAVGGKNFSGVFRVLSG